jgi:hypothetical protein
VGARLDLQTGALERFNRQATPSLDRKNNVVFHTDPVKPQLWTPFQLMLKAEIRKLRSRSNVKVVAPLAAGADVATGSEE